LKHTQQVLAAANVQYLLRRNTNNNQGPALFSGPPE